jgi:hypothetical protein
MRQRAAMRRSAAAVAALAALLLGAAAADARLSSSPQKWVSAFCGSVLTWEHTVKSSSAGFTSDMTKIQSGGDVDLRAAKKRFVGFFGGLVAATGAMTSKVQGRGAPDVPNGAKLQQGVLGGFAKVSKLFRDARKKALSLPTNDRKAFAGRTVVLGQAISASGSKIGDSFQVLSKYDSPALDKAAANEPACKALGG